MNSALFNENMKKQGERVRVTVYNKTLKVIMLLPMENSRGKE